MLCGEKKLVVVTTLVNVSHTTNILLHHTFIILKSKVAVITCHYGA